MILVDDAMQYPEHMVSTEAKRRGHARKRWCHMTSDTSAEELHKFAWELGLKRTWFQGDHYDLTESKRREALVRGAIEVSGAELFARSCFGA